MALDHASVNEQHRKLAAAPFPLLFGMKSPNQETNERLRIPDQRSIDASAVITASDRIVD
jgi:hypothetical protein